MCTYIYIYPHRGGMGKFCGVEKDDFSTICERESVWNGRRGTNYSLSRIGKKRRKFSLKTISTDVTTLCVYGKHRKRIVVGAMEWDE